MDGWTDGRTGNKCTEDWIDGWIIEGMDGQMDGWMDGDIRVSRVRMLRVLQLSRKNREWRWIGKIQIAKDTEAVE